MSRQLSKQEILISFMRDEERDQLIKDVLDFNARESQSTRPITYHIDNNESGKHGIKYFLVSGFSTVHQVFAFGAHLGRRGHA